MFAFVSWPSAPLTDSLVRRTLGFTQCQPRYVLNRELAQHFPLLQWSTYDDLDHELSLSHRRDVLTSSYTFRKALIRKHYLSRIIQSYVVKEPHSILKTGFPLTFEIEISFADELEAMWTDELWELANILDSESSWWIMKPGMADRGMGIRLFHSKEDLENIFTSFDEDEDEGEGEGEHEDATAIITSQLRHFVLQEYIAHPLLLDPSEVLNKGAGRASLAGRKFHLRVYCVSRGAIQVYIYTRVLALFASTPYVTLESQSSGKEAHQLDLSPHLTNTSLQTQLGDENVRLLDELVGCQFLSGKEEVLFAEKHVQNLVQQTADILAETFQAALQNPVHFQPLPNAFELFGVDFLISHEEDGTLQAKLLEINAEPAIELTGHRLRWILDDLFESIGTVCVEPFFNHHECSGDEWVVGETRHNLMKCKDVTIRLLE